MEPPDSDILHNSDMTLPDEEVSSLEARVNKLIFLLKNNAESREEDGKLLVDQGQLKKLSDTLTKLGPENPFLNASDVRLETNLFGINNLIKEEGENGNSSNRVPENQHDTSPVTVEEMAEIFIKQGRESYEKPILKSLTQIKDQLVGYISTNPSFSEENMGRIDQILKLIDDTISKKNIEDSSIISHHDSGSNEASSVRGSNEPSCSRGSNEPSRSCGSNKASGSSDKKKKKQKKKEEEEYIPKFVNIAWSDPRLDKEFAKELEDLTNCDLFDVSKLPSLHAPMEELDSISENVEPCRLPRDIVKMFMDAPLNDVADWDYSIQVEKGECSDSEEDEETVRQFMEEELARNRTEARPPPLIPGGSLNVLEHFETLMPPNVEDIVGVRDEMGKIISYKMILRSKEHISKECDRVYLEDESSSEEEDEDEEEKKEETEEGDEDGILWERDDVKSCKAPQFDDRGITERELQENLKSIKKYFDSKEDLTPNIDPHLKRQMNFMNKFLDDCGVPNDMDVKVTLDETDKLSHITQLHEGKICLPGTLTCRVTREEIEEIIAALPKGKPFDPMGEPIAGPSELHLRLPPEMDEPEETFSQNSEEFQSTSKDCEDKPLFPDEIDEPEPRITTEEHNFFEKDESSEEEVEDGEDKTMTRKQWNEAFLEEYFRRGGTEEGLGVEDFDGDWDLSKESLASYTEKYVTFPFISKYSAHFDVVQFRRLIARHFPRFKNEAFADLTKVEPELSESESSSESEPEVHLTPEPFDFEDIVKSPGPTAQCAECDNKSWLTPDEDEDSDFEPLEPPNISLDKTQGVKKRKKKKSKNKNVSDSDSEEERSPEDVVATWSPIDRFKGPSHEAFESVMEEVHKLLEKKVPKFKPPKEIKAWIRGEYTPSEEDVREWKRIFAEVYGTHHTVMETVLTPEKSEAYLKLLRSLEADGDDDNFIMQFEQILAEQKLAQEHGEEAQEILVNPSAPDEKETSETKNEKELTQNEKELIQNEKELTQNEKELIQNEKELTQNEKKLTQNEKELTQDLANLSVKEQPAVEDSVEAKDESSDSEDFDVSMAESKILPQLVRVIKLKDVKVPLKKEEWAEELDCNHKRPLTVTNPAMSFPFELDGFQREAIEALEAGLNVFVSAHTSAGKTVVAEYAIAMSKRNRSKAVYTSPVKALSNQKYADFKRIFGSVGLITGDIQLNENAECLIMTTEILRSMLYNSSEKIRDLEFVVFDEVHYINDPERGHVWEEVLILLPSQVQVVMLSATVPNTLEFANWVGRTKQRKVMVCATQHRPVPLNHYLYTGTGGPSPGDIYLLKSADGTFNLQEYQKAEQVMKAAQEKERQNKKKVQLKRMEEEKEWKKKGNPGRPPVPPHEEQQFVNYKKDQTMFIALTQFLVKRDMLPAVCFVFSRRKCDMFAEMLLTVDLTTKSEKSFIHKFIKSQIQKLDEVDQSLPQIQVMKEQLDKGIGVHHSGILPVMKEIVEVLFQDGKVKLLFATETFAMGVNMPARTVVFQAVRKFDGVETRLLQPAEYVQMAGRAGRRGKDSAGNVLILTRPHEVIAHHDLVTLLYGNPNKLISKFRLSYRMILNTLTVSGMLTVQNMMERSFCENHGQMKKQYVEKDLINAEEKEKGLKKNLLGVVEEAQVNDLAKFYDLSFSFIEEWAAIRAMMIFQSRLFKELVPGRLIQVCKDTLIHRTALLLEIEHFPEDVTRNNYKAMILYHTKDFERAIAPDGHEMEQEEIELWYKMVSLMSDLPNELDMLCGQNYYSVVNIKAENITGVFREHLKLPKNVFFEFMAFLMKKNQQFGKNKVSEAGDAIARVLVAQTGRTTLIDERTLTYESFAIGSRVSYMWTIFDDLKEYKVSFASQQMMNSFRRVFRWKQASREVNKLRQILSVENMSLYPDFMNKMDLLKERGYINQTEQVQMKGYMAARISKFELIVCEMLVENVLSDLSPEEVAALLSFLVYQSTSDDGPMDGLPPNLKKAIDKCKSIMKEVSELEKSFGIGDYEGSEIGKMNFGLAPVMYDWARQVPLKNIMEMGVDFQEGMLVRWIQQLLETLKEVESAAKLMGDPAVPAALQSAGQAIKRGIVFAPSLYTTML